MSILNLFSATADGEMLLRLFIAAILGLLMGLEREYKRKALGLKTILVIAIVSCLLTIVSIQAAYTLPPTMGAEIRMDPLRLAAQIVTGVGFLGAGVILHRENAVVSGLTTAAIVWGAAGIGIATGAGFYVEAIAGVTFILISVEVIPAIVRRTGFRTLNVQELEVKITIDETESLQKLLDEMKKKITGIVYVYIKDIDSKRHVVTLHVDLHQRVTIPELYDDMRTISVIRTIEISS
ncbi:MAG TPA: MgtC/SapB family protein [Pseudogracilibacillus sp.]|nr:MgtC/SapB family protein [Pseudogracilibacillus sp.]